MRGSTLVRPRSPALRLGLALSAEAATVVVRGRSQRPQPGSPLRYPLAAPARDGGWPELAEALRAALATQGGAAALVDVAVLPPLARCKRLLLPPLAEPDLTRLVEQGAEQFFPVPRGAAMAAGITPLPRPPHHRGGVPVLAAVIEQALLDAVHAAVEAAGCAVGTVTAGPVALAAGARALVPALGRGTAAVVVRGEGWVEALLLARGRLRLARSRPAPPSGANPGEEWVREILADGLGPAVERLACVGFPAGAPPAPGGVPRTEVPDLSGEAMAALGATLPGADAPAFQTGTLRRALVRRQRLRTRVLGALAALLLVAAAALHLAGVERQAGEIAARRAQLRPAVLAATRARAGVHVVERRVRAVEARERERAEWTGLLGRVAAALPREAYLTSLRVEGGKLRLEGRAPSAVALVPLFEAQRWVDSVRLGSAVSREQTAGGVSERFSLLLDLRRGARGGR